MKRLIIPGVFALVILLSFSIGRPKISEFRGSERSGIYDETDLMKEWPAGGPKEIMSLENIGNGYGSPVFSGSLFYITGEIDSMAVLSCYNLKGVKQWQSTLGREWTKSRRGSRSAPTIADDRIYVGTGMGNLYCLNKENGKIIWSKDFVRDFNGVMPLHGHSEAPLIDGDKVFWTPGGKEFNAVALERFTGKLLWSNKGFGERSAYHNPRVIEAKSLKILVTFSAYHMMGFDTKTGKMLWSHEQDNTPPDKRAPGYGDTHCNTVIFEKGTIWYAAGDGNCGVKLSLSDDGSTIREVWRNKDLDSYMGGVLKIGNWLYCGGTEKPQIVSVNAESGLNTDSLRIGSGAIIAADNMIYYYTQKGDMDLIGYKDGKLTKVSSFRITKGTGEHFSHPVINKGVLYQRHGKILLAYYIGNKQDQI